MRLLDRARPWSTLALACVAIAYGSLVQGAGSNQTGHYALVKSFAEGTAIVDRTRYEVGDAGTMDVSWYHGHYYIAKAPGLAAASLPPYLALRSLGARTSGDPTNMLWALGLFTVVLPVFVLLLLVRGVAESFAPGLGTAAAVTLGLGTLLLPFGTMFFAHALSALLGFAAFAVLWRERDRAPRWRAVVVAAALAGLAATVEYPLALVGLALLVMVAARPPRLQRIGVYCAVLALTASSLLFYNRWAFGNALHFPYNGVVAVAGRTGHDQLQHFGFYGMGVPSFRGAMQLLFADWGLLITSPVLAAAAVGIAFLYRGGRRVEAITIAAVSVVVPVYTSGVIRSYGDVAPGPRYLIPALPFLAVALAAAFRELPLTTSVLATGSALVFVAVTATRPMKAWDGHVFDRLKSTDGHSSTVSDLVGFTGVYHMAPFLLALAGAVACVLAATRLRATRGEAPLAAAALVGWIVSAWVAPSLDQFRSFGDAAKSVVFPLSAAALTAVVGRALRSSQGWALTSIEPK